MNLFFFKQSWAIFFTIFKTIKIYNSLLAIPNEILYTMWDMFWTNDKVYFIESLSKYLTCALFVYIILLPITNYQLPITNYQLGKLYSKIFSCQQSLFSFYLPSWDNCTFSYFVVCRVVYIKNIIFNYIKCEGMLGWQAISLQE